MGTPTLSPPPPQRRRTYALPGDVWVQSPSLATTHRAHVEPDLVAALVPHAASPESLRLLDFVYQRLPLNQPGMTVLCLSTCHAPLPDGIDAALPPFDRMRLPGGGPILDIDTAARATLSAVDRVHVSTTSVYEGEHSWRVQVAALARAHPTTSVRVLPVLVRRHTPALARSVCSVLGHHAVGKTPHGSRAILVGNSDLLHCGADSLGWPPCPPSPPTTDQETMRAVVHAITTRTHRTRTPPSSTSLALTHTSACGTAVLRTFVAVAQSHRPQWRLAHTRYACCCAPSSSSSTGGGTRHHVGYPCLTLRDPRLWRVSLARLPRLLVERHLFVHCSEQRVTTDTLEHLARSYICMPASTPRAPFVTLHTAADHRLRGCIGTFALHSPAELPAAVATYTWQAACNDTRFAPLHIDERDALAYELHLNHAPTTIWARKHTSTHGTLPRRTSVYKAVQRHIVVGTHGVTLTMRDGRQATFLASVLPESFGCVRGTRVTMAQWRRVERALREKAGSTAPVVTVSRYECETLNDSHHRPATHPPKAATLRTARRGRRTTRRRRAVTTASGSRRVRRRA